MNFWGTKNIIGIGERARSYYAKFAPAISIPYSQDLNFINSNSPIIKNNKDVCFLFSGQLIKRHNIDIILNSINLLHKEVGANFKFIFAAKGELMFQIETFINYNPNLRNLISFDNDYLNWNDRLRPFYNSDVLVYPSNHSGWGLVVPEALACGLIVISTNKVESSRFFIKHNVNGIIIRESKKELFEAMLRCVKNRKWLKERQNNAFLSSLKGDISTVAPLLIKHFLKTISN